MNILSDDYLIVSDPDICGGKPVVRGTRVPVQYILELWELGYSVEGIHEQYPTVPRELVERLLKLLKEEQWIKIQY